MKNVGFGFFGAPGASPGGSFKKCKRSFVHHGLLKLPFKFDYDRKTQMYSCAPWAS